MKKDIINTSRSFLMRQAITESNPHNLRRTTSKVKVELDYSEDFARKRNIKFQSKKKVK